MVFFIDLLLLVLNKNERLYKVLKSLPLILLKWFVKKNTGLTQGVTNNWL